MFGGVRQTHRPKRIQRAPASRIIFPFIPLPDLPASISRLQVASRLSRSRGRAAGVRSAGDELSPDFFRRSLWRLGNRVRYLGERLRVSHPYGLGGKNRSSFEPAYLGGVAADQGRRSRGASCSIRPGRGGIFALAAGGAPSPSVVYSRSSPRMNWIRRGFRRRTDSKAQS